MATIDLPLDELKTYPGRNPKPEDFDRFWEKGLEEIRNTDPQTEFESSSFQAPYADCRHMYFTGTDGARIHVKNIMPAKSSGSKVPAVLMFHGYGMNAGDWTDKLSYAAAGYAVFAMDVRGQGGHSTDPGGVTGNTLQGHVTRGLDDEPEKLFYRNVFLDTALLAKTVMDMSLIDEENVSATGWSQGGGLSLACSALEPRIRKAAAVYPFLSDYRRVWELDLAIDAYQDIRRYFRRFDPQHKREDEVFSKLGYIDVQHLAPRIKAETMMATGLMDEVCPPSSQFAAYNKINCPKRLELYHDFAHENLPGLHDKIFSFITG